MPKSPLLKKEYAVLLGLLILGGLLMWNHFPASLTGFTTLSVSQSQFTSTNSFFTGNVYILTLAQGGMGQSASGTISPTDVSSKGSTKQPTDSFDIDISYQSQRCEYPITSNTQATPIYSYTYRTWTYDYNPLHLGCQEDTALQQCGLNAIYYGKFAMSWNCFCVAENSIVSAIAYNSIQNPYVHTIATITTSGGKNNALNGELDIDTKGTIQGFVGSNSYAVWNGYLVQNVCPTNPDQYVAYFNNGRWQLGSSANYQNYANMRNIYLPLIKSPDIPSEAELQNYINSINGAEQQALAISSFGNGITNPTSVSSAVIYQEMPEQIQVPVYTLYVKADAIGIYQPVSDIKINSLNWASFKTQGTIEVNLYNAGDSQGNANVYAICNSPVQNSNTVTVGLGAKAHQMTYLTVSGSVSQPTQVSCVVHVVNSAGSSYTQTVTTTETSENTCVANQYICDTNTVRRCNSYGSGYDSAYQVICSSEEICSFNSNNVAYCKGLGTNMSCIPEGESINGGLFGWLESTLFGKSSACCTGLSPDTNGVCRSSSGFDINTLLIIGVILGLGLIILIIIVATSPGKRGKRR